MTSLKEKRKETGLTVDDMAEGLGVTARTVFNYESHPEDLTVAKAIKIASLLGCGLDEIFLPDGGR